MARSFLLQNSDPSTLWLVYALKRLRIPGGYKVPWERLPLLNCSTSALRVPECNAHPCSQRAFEPTVPSMQRHRPQFLAPRWTLLRRDLLDTRERILESRAAFGRVSPGLFWPAGPVQTKPRRNGLGPGPGFAQAAFQAAPTGSSRGLSPFEPQWRAGSLCPAPLRVGAAITMATVATQPCAGGSRDILWRVSAAPSVVCVWPLRGPAGLPGADRACALGGGGAGLTVVGSAWGRNFLRGGSLPGCRGGVVSGSSYRVGRVC